MAETNTATMDEAIEEEIDGAIEELREAAFVEELKDKLKEIFSDKRVGIATVVFTVEGEEDPQIYRKGHFYDTAALMNHVLSAYRAKAAVELGL